MKALVIYDSLYGNTELIAKAIGENIEGLTMVLRVHGVNIEKLKNVDLLVVGSPVHGGRPTPDLEEFLLNLPDGFLKEKKVAAFDTRFASEDHNVALKLLMRIIRYAAERLAKILVKKGGILVSTPHGFIVNEKRGPLKQGELERARKWGRELSTV